MDTSLNFKSFYNQLVKDINTKGHPYKFSCLSTINNNTPEQRMVVIREIKENTIVIFTDPRTPKVNQIIKNPSTSLLLYHPEKLKQIILKGNCKVINDTSKWEQIPNHSYRDYTSVEVPGTNIKNMKPNYNNEKPNFCIIEFEFNHVDYLQISREFNLRIKFSKNNDLWTSSYVAP